MHSTAPNLLSAASGKSSTFGSHWMQRPVKNGPCYYTRSCAALRAADLGLSDQDAFAQWHSFDPKNVTWQTQIFEERQKQLVAIHDRERCLSHHTCVCCQCCLNRHSMHCFLFLRGGGHLPYKRHEIKSRALQTYSTLPNSRWQKLAAFRRGQNCPQNFRQARICYFRDKCVVFHVIAILQI